MFFVTVSSSIILGLKGAFKYDFWFIKVAKLMCFCDCTYVSSSLNGQYNEWMDEQVEPAVHSLV